MIGVLISFIFQFLFPFPLLDVGLYVKVGEKDKKHGAMEQNHVAEYFWEITLDEEWKAGVDKEGHKLSHLQLGQISFPPEVFLDARPHGRHEVVEVHDDVDAHVEEPAEGGVSATNKPNSKP